VLDLTQTPGSVLNAYGWACLIFLVVTMGEAIRNELSGRARLRMGISGRCMDVPVGLSSHCYGRVVSGGHASMMNAVVVDGG